MGTMISLFIVVVILVLAFLFILVLAMKKYPKASNWFEIIGYILLAISLGWSIVFNITTDLSNESDMYEINEKLKMIWLFQDDLYYFIDNKDSNTFNKTFGEKTNSWIDLEKEAKRIELQEKIVKYIYTGLIILSTILIACGRGGELLHNALKGEKKDKNRDNQLIFALLERLKNDMKKDS